MKYLSRFGAILVATLLSASLTGCVMHSEPGDGDGERDSSTDSTQASLMGRVQQLQGDGGNPVQATVTVNGQQHQTNEQGWFSVADVPEGERLLIEIAADGYVSTQRIVTVEGGSQGFIDARLFERAPAQQFDASQGGELSFDNARVMFPPDALQTSDGSTFSGAAFVSLTTIDPSLEGAQMATPGDFTALPGESDEASRLETYGMVNLDVTDGDGNELDIDDSADAQVWIPVAEGLSGQNPPATMPMWRYDESQGRWLENGGLDYDSESNCYQGTVDQPAYWNADMLYESACVSGRIVKPDGNGAPSVQVIASGVGYLGDSIAWTDSEGRFEVEVMASSADRTVGAEIQAQGGGLYLDTPVAVPETPTALAESGECADIGEVTLVYPLARFVLGWGENPSDLDTHLTGPTADGGERFHLFYSNMNISGQATLDTDDTSSYGPEVTSILDTVPGTYVYSIKNYSGEGSHPIADSGAKVDVFMPSGARTFEVENATMSAEGTSTIWRVFKFDINSNGSFGSIEPIEEIVDETEQAFEP